MSYISPFTGDVVQPTDVSYRYIALSADTELSWPINGNITGNYAARIMDVLPSTSGLKLYMPPADQTSVGTDALVRNLGSDTFTLVDFDGNTIISIAAGVADYAYLTNNTTAAGAWGVIAFGAGSSSADAASLAGYGLLAITTTLNQSHPTQSISSGAVFSASDRAQMKLWGSGAGTATLPLSSVLGNNWFTLFKNNGSGTFIVSTDPSEMIDGATTKAFAPGESAFIICTGSEYVTIGYGTSQTFIFTALVKGVTGGTYVLTASEAGNIIQEYVGNLVANVTVQFPPVVNLYVVSNQTTDNGYSLTITTGISGSFTAVIPPGQQATLICDGTNFLNANTTQAGASTISLLDGTVGTPSLNFASETNTGVYRPGAGRFGISILGNQAVDISSSGMKVPVGISGGTY